MKIIYIIVLAQFLTMTCFAKDIKVMTWNIWDGGVHGKKAIGFAENQVNTDNIIKVIMQNEPDVIFMQETYCCGMDIAKVAGYLYSQRGSANLSIHSKYPIVGTKKIFNEANSHGVVIDVEGQLILCVNVWLNYLPDYFSNFDIFSSDRLLNDEKETRLVEIKTILDEVDNFSKILGIPIIVGGDFNSSSHLDWTEDTKDAHFGKVVNWSVSNAMADNGYADSFREVNPDPNKTLHGTWGYLEEGSVLSDRIDYIYYKGEGLNPIKSKIVMDDPEGGFFNSDHRAILTEFNLNN